MVLSSAAPMSINGPLAPSVQQVHFIVKYYILLFWSLNVPYIHYMLCLSSDMASPGIYCHWYRVTKEGKPISMSNQNPFADPSVISFADLQERILNNDALSFLAGARLPLPSIQQQAGSAFP